MKASVEPEVRARVRASLADFAVLSYDELQNVFAVISGEDGATQTDGFVAFYRSDGDLDAAKHEPQVRTREYCVPCVRTVRTVRTVRAYRACVPCVRTVRAYRACGRGCVRA
jgi:hypothetical protein